MAVSTTYAPSYEKDPSDTIDYTVSWHHLGGDTILTSTWESDGLTIGTDSISGLTTTVFASGGTVGAVHSLTNTVTTGMGRTLQRTVYIAVAEL
jgi:hypothetical protein